MADTTDQRIGTAQGLDLAISLCLTYTLCIVCIRLWIRKGAFGFDDLVVLITTILTLGHTAADYVALANGLGRSWQDLIDGHNLPPLNSTTIAGIVTFIIALYMTKMCVLAFLCRITKNRTQINMYYGCAVVLALLGLASILTVTANCHAGSGFYWAFWGNTRSCPSQVLRWQIFTAFDVITELLLLVLPVQLVWSLQMPIRKKAVVLTAFFLRAPVIALTVARNVFTLNLRNASSDPGKDGAIVVIWLEVELAYALASSTLSALKTFTESFNSGFGQGFTRARDNYDMSGLSKESKNSSRGGEKVKATSTVATDGEQEESSRDIAASMSNGALSKAWPDSRRDLQLRPESDGVNFTRVSSEPGRNWKHEANGSDSSRDDLFIVRETELSVHHDEAPMLRHVR